MSAYFEETSKDASSSIMAMRVWRLQCERCDYFEYTFIDSDGAKVECPECATVSRVRSES